jgi:predicted RNA-binding Zn-ribbon protein involved in translation (DUF1610 family)
VGSDNSECTQPSDECLSCGAPLAPDNSERCPRCGDARRRVKRIVKGNDIYLNASVGGTGRSAQSVFILILALIALISWFGSAIITGVIALLPRGLLSLLFMLKGILQVALLFVSGWFGEWSFIMAFFRSVKDWLRGGSAFPRIVSPVSWYGLTWAVKMHRGGISRKDLLMEGVGLLLIPAILWIFYELFKAAT